LTQTCSTISPQWVKKLTLLNEIARQWAATLQGTPRYLHAPAFVSAGLKRSLANEDGIGSTLGLWDEATAALVGIGAWPKNDPTLVAAGFQPAIPRSRTPPAMWSAGSSPRMGP
jgi:DNA-binding transcriptional regulator LsrR (DeoR family)